MSDSKIFEKIFSNQFDRENYFISYIGIKDENLYNLEFFKTSEIINKRKDIVLFTQSIQNPNDFNIINLFKEKVVGYKGSIENLQIDIIKSEEMNNKIKKAFDIFLELEKEAFKNDRVKENFIIKIMSWIKMFIDSLEIEKNDFPKIIFYSDIKKHELYFLTILYLSGFDILYLNPNSNDILEILDIKKYKISLEEEELKSEYLTFDERMSLGEIIDKSCVRKAMTIGAQASKRISDELLNDAGFIKPWQLQDRKIKNLLLSSTIDEISIYWKQPLKLRPGFSFDEKIVQAPVFLSKLNGIYNDSKEYIKLVSDLRDLEDVYFIEYTGDINDFSSEFTKEAFSLSFALNSNNRIDKKYILDENCYPISILNKNQQYLILEKIEEVIASDMFLMKLNKEDIIRGLYTTLHMNKRLVHMINNFDYSLVNPKIIIYIKKSTVFNKELVFLIILLSKMGFDIIILAPGGENCIENVVNNELMDIHRLDKMVYDFKLDSVNEEGNLFQKIFGKRSGFKWG